MSTPVKPIPEGFRSLTPHIVVDDGTKAIAFYKEAFGAELLGEQRTPDGKIMNAAMKIGDSIFMLNDEFPQWGVVGPNTLEGTPVTMHIYTEDADAAWARALNAGCRVGMELQKTFWGDRYGMVLDPFGHHWAIAMRVEDLTPEQITEASRKAGM